MLLRFPVHKILFEGQGWDPVSLSVTEVSLH